MLSPESGAPPGFTVELTTDQAGVELIPLPPRIDFYILLAPFLTVFALFWNGVTVTLIIGGICNPANSTYNGVPGPAPWWFYALFLSIGLGFATGAFCAAFLRRRWVVGRGWIARRWRITVLSRYWDRLYDEVERLEIRHGFWDSGYGSTDTLRFWTAGTKRPVTFWEWEYIGRMEQLRDQMIDPGTGRINWLRSLNLLKSAGTASEQTKWEVRPDIMALGQFLGRHTGTALTVIEEVIPTPRRPGGP